MIDLFFEFIIIGIAGGLLGIFYRNCLKPKDMIFNKIYKVLELWTISSRYDPRSSVFQRFLGWIAYPLGYCIYCSTPVITIILCIIYLSSWCVLPKWQYIVIGIVLAMGIQHIIVASACRWLINKHPNLD